MLNSHVVSDYHFGVFKLFVFFNKIFTPTHEYAVLPNLWMAYLHLATKSNTTGIIGRAGTAYLSGAHVFYPEF